LFVHAHRLPPAKAGWWAPFCAGIIAELLGFSNQDLIVHNRQEFTQLHWPGFPYPPNYEPSSRGLLAAMFAIVLIFLAIVFYAAKSSAPLLHEPEPEPDETEPEEKDRNKMAE
jgi:hypothetical protein